jgi:hypothetical protein
MSDQAGGAGSATAALDALQTALSAENAAVYGYGIIGAHLAGPQRVTATAGWVAHQVSRDELEKLVRARGGEPGPAAVAYRLPARVQTAAQARSLAVILEDRVSAAYLGLVALSDLALRQQGARQMTQAALRAASWRGTTVSFPGLPASALAPRPGAATRGPRARG